MHQLVNIVVKGGNLLLSIGPNVKEISSLWFINIPNISVKGCKSMTKQFV